MVKGILSRVPNYLIIYWQAREFVDAKDEVVVTGRYNELL